MIWMALDVTALASAQFSAYSFRATIGSKCIIDIPCATEQNWIQAYWVTHQEA
jgi:hypothetical protein